MKSIYCGPGECILLPPYTFAQLEQCDQSECCQDVPSSPVSLELKLTIPRDQEVLQSCSGVTITVTFELSRSYPELSPQSIVLSSEYIGKAALDELQQNMLSYARLQQPEPCLFSILEMLKDSTMEMIANDPSCLLEKSLCSGNHPQASRNVHACQDPLATYPELHASVSVRPVDGKCSSNKYRDPSVCVVRIDHMRNEQKYFKILKSWAKELGIRGKVLNAGLHDIYVVVAGSDVSVSELLRRWKSQSVDVDSQGKPCKEKMISILYRQKLDQPVSCRLVSFWTPFFGEVRSIINVYSLFLSSLSTPGLELVHCTKAELASHFNSETYLQHAFECVKPKC